MDMRPHCSGMLVTRVPLFFCRRKQEEVATLESTIRQRSEQQKKAGVELDATCHICLKTKFADGVGHICHYCKIRCCARCGGKVTLRSNKVSLAICALHYPDLSLAHQQPLVPFLLTFHTHPMSTCPLAGCHRICLWVTSDKHLLSILKGWEGRFCLCHPLSRQWCEQDRVLGKF